MIERLDNLDAEDTVWVVRPTRSLTWPEAKRWLCAISVLPLSGGLLFLYFGIPLVLPFAGLEIALLWAAFYHVARSGQDREVIRLTDARLIIERGRREPEERLEYDRAWVRVRLDENRGWHPSQLSIGSHGKLAPVGAFLTDGERKTLAESLINALAKNR
jgi:uncharacterized membrane protein